MYDFDSDMWCLLARWEQQWEVGVWPIRGDLREDGHWSPKDCGQRHPSCTQCTGSTCEQEIII